MTCRLILHVECTAMRQLLYETQHAGTRSFCKHIACFHRTHPAAGSCSTARSCICVCCVPAMQHSSSNHHMNSLRPRPCATHPLAAQSCCELDIISGCFKVSASRPWSPGQQVVISYGPSSNDVLLLLYGFVAGSNPQDRWASATCPHNLLQTPRKPTSACTA
jgi:hypothetical protein